MYLRFWHKARPTPHPVSEPVVVHGLPARQPSAVDTIHQRRHAGSAQLPLPSSFRFENIIAAIDTPDFQSSINAIAVVCAKSRMSLADAHDSHRLPHVGDVVSRHRPGRTLSIVPEANSSSEASGSDDGRKVRDNAPHPVNQENIRRRQIPISSIPGLRRLSVSCEPVLGLSTQFER